jgi:hypothetical protein
MGGATLAVKRFQQQRQEILMRREIRMRLSELAYR